VTHATDESTPSPPSEAGGEDTAPELNRLGQVSSDPQFEQVVGDVIVRGLGSSSDPQVSVRNTVDMLSRYLHDWSTGTLLVSLLAHWDSDSYGPNSIDEVDDDAARRRLSQIMSRLAALYGRELKVGFDLTTRNAEDWQYIECRTSYELERAEWTIAVTLDSFGGTTHRIVGPPRSFLRLVNRLTDRLVALSGFLESEFGANFDQDDINEFLNSSRQLADGLSPSASERSESPSSHLKDDL
jgi:hypothetical protein